MMICIFGCVLIVVLSIVCVICDVGFMCYFVGSIGLMVFSVNMNSCLLNWNLLWLLLIRFGCMYVSELKLILVSVCLILFFIWL